MGLVVTVNSAARYLKLLTAARIALLSIVS
jgi:hypothetical protein